MDFSFLKSRGKEKEIEMVEVDKISPNPFQPRSEFNQKDIEELAESIKNFGIIQPLIVRPTDDGYELIAGERRIRAAIHLGREKVPAIVKDFSDRETAEIALVENLQRKDLDYLEESLAYASLLQEFDLTQTELAEKLGKSQSTIANKLRLLKLPLMVRKELKSPLITERHARALLRLEDETQQLQTVKEIKEKELTVRETGQLIEKIKKDSNGERKEDKKGGITYYGDLRIVTNTLNNTINEMKKSGLDIKVKKEDKDDYVEYRIRIPREK